MLLSLVLNIAPQSDSWDKRPAAVRALAYAVFALSDTALVDRLHSLKAEKPFTAAVLPEPNATRLRLTALTDETGQALLRAVRTLSQTPTLTFAETTVTVQGCDLVCPPLAETTSCLALCLTPFAPRVALSFPRPTAFSQNGLHLPLPVPDLLLRGWGRRWNAVAPEEAVIEGELLTGLAGKVALAQARIETRTTDLQVTKMVGFTGRIVLEAIRPDTWTNTERSAFAALTQFSRFCGTGVWTTQGMGLTLPTEKD